MAKESMTPAEKEKRSGFRAGSFGETGVPAFAKAKCCLRAASFCRGGKSVNSAGGDHDGSDLILGRAGSGSDSMHRGCCVYDGVGAAMEKPAVCPGA